MALKPKGIGQPDYQKFKEIEPRYSLRELQEMHSSQKFNEYWIKVQNAQQDLANEVNALLMFASKYGVSILKELEPKKRVLSSEEKEIVKDRLRGLGYL